MKMCIKKSFVLSVFVVGLELVLAGRLSGQTFKTLHNFSGSDGLHPNGHLVLSGNTLYGTTYGDGNSAHGTVFSINTDGTGFRTLYRFSGGTDGGGPAAGLISSSNVLYGTTIHGTPDYGTVFGINTDGTGFTNLYNFSGGSDGSEPYSVLLLQGNILYGTTHLGGDFGWGVVFGVNTDGSGSVTLHSFSGGDDGRIPFCKLVLLNNLLMGTAPGGGSSGSGTLFAVGIDDMSFTNPYSFTAGSSGTNSDGAGPYAGLTLSGNALYGTAVDGGSSGDGTIFKVNTDGTGFTTLYSFTALSNGGSGTNMDGASPGYIGGEMTLSGSILYGTAGFGGRSGNGTAFAIGTDGTGFVTLHSFAGGSEGAQPNGGLVLSDNNLFGTTWHNSNAAGTGNGTIFSISLPSPTPPQLTITPSDRTVVLTWATNFVGFTLQSATNLLSPVWTTNLPAPVILNGQYTLTNPISGAQQFFRLSQ
jgi:uncharacterized repeat protein (TIGR03803 family)